MSYEQEPTTVGAFGAAGHSKLFWDSSNNIQTSALTVERLTREITSMAQQVESSRLAYNDVLSERDQLKEQAKVAEQRLSEVQRVVARYAVVEDPVVASDGFTYERRVIKQYLEDCKNSKSEAISQQTKEILDDSLVSNHSLRKLVDLVKDVRPDVVPELSERRPIAALGSAIKTGGRRDHAQHQQQQQQPPAHSQGGDDDGVVLASDLEATWSAAVKTTGPDRRGDRGDRRGDRDDRREERRDDRRDDRREERRDRGDRGDRDQGSSGSRNHPCIRVYGFCNFKDECQFARYPYDACLNNIKGKCRFGNSCKELHVNANDKKFQNPKAAASQQGGAPAPRDSGKSTDKSEGRKGKK